MAGAEIHFTNPWASGSGKINQIGVIQASNVYFGNFIDNDQQEVQKSITNATARGHTRALEDYQIGFICALSVELTAAIAALDEVHSSPPTLEGDSNVYKFGRIAGHNVIIACLPSGTYGTNSAAIAAVQLLRSFPLLKFGILIGIGGGAPNVDEGVDIRLGDVVVGHPNNQSSGVIQYDLGKAFGDGQGFTRTGALNKPPRMLANAVALLKSHHMTKPGSLSRQMEKMVSKENALGERSKHPGSQKDLLFNNSTHHVLASRRNCDACDKIGLVERTVRKSSDASIFYGTIGSGNLLLKDPQIRDRLRDSEKILCFEMEAAGIIDTFPCLVVRGIADYCDTHKNDTFHLYAALNAAAYAKELLLQLQIPTSTPNKTAQITASSFLNSTVNLYQPNYIKGQASPIINSYTKKVPSHSTRESPHHNVISILFDPEHIPSNVIGDVATRLLEIDVLCAMATHDALKGVLDGHLESDDYTVKNAPSDIAKIQGILDEHRQIERGLRIIKTEYLEDNRLIQYWTMTKNFFLQWQDLDTNKPENKPFFDRVSQDLDKLAPLTGDLSGYLIAAERKGELNKTMLYVVREKWRRLDDLFDGSSFKTGRMWPRTPWLKVQMMMGR